MGILRLATNEEIKAAAVHARGARLTGADKNILPPSYFLLPGQQDGVVDGELDLQRDLVEIRCGIIACGGVPDL